MTQEKKIYTHNAILFSLFVMWIELENSMLRGVSQAQKDNCYMCSGRQEAKVLISWESASYVIKGREGEGERDMERVFTGAVG